jgi:hypothetical protein
LSENSSKYLIITDLVMNDFPKNINGSKANAFAEICRKTLQGPDSSD